jgi:hypothetical protein
MRGPSEEAYAVAVCHQLWRSGWVPYPELNGLADIVAHNPATDDLIAVEVKRMPNMEVVAQADHRYTTGGVNGFYVAVPRHTRHFRYLDLLCKELGIGVVGLTLGFRGETEFGVRACRRRHPQSSPIRKLLIPAARDYTRPGRKSPKQFTPFRLREMGLHAILVERGPMTPRALCVAEAAAQGLKKPLPTRPVEEYARRGAWDTLRLNEAGEVVIAFSWGSPAAGHGKIDYPAEAWATQPDLFAPTVSPGETVEVAAG